MVRVVGLPGRGSPFVHISYSQLGYVTASFRDARKMRFQSSHIAKILASSVAAHNSCNEFGACLANQ